MFLPPIFILSAFVEPGEILRVGILNPSHQADRPKQMKTKEVGCSCEYLISLIGNVLVQGSAGVARTDNNLQQ